MRILKTYLPATLVALLISTVSPLVATDNSTKTNAPSSASPAASTQPELKLAMSAAQVREIMGQPKKIKPMKSDKGKVEIWIYDRPLDERFEQVPVATPIMSSVWGQDGQMHDVKVGDSMQFHELRHITNEVTEVLMFNDHFVTKKVHHYESQHLQ